MRLYGARLPQYKRDTANKHDSYRLFFNDTLVIIHMNTASSPSLWAFACALYAQPGVESACITLQERHQRNVNLVLYCCWLGANSHVLTVPAALQVASFIPQWSAKWVVPLRQLRQQMKTAPPEGDMTQDWQVLREQLLQLELGFERYLLDSMKRFDNSASRDSAFCAVSCEPVECVIANLRRCGVLDGGTDAVVELVTVLLRALFPSFNSRIIEAHLLTKR